MKKGEKIIAPKYINKMKDYRKVDYYSFFYNKSVKDKQTGEWQIKERYAINVMNVSVEPDDEIEITDILDAKPQICKDKKGKEYMNCLLWVKADNLGKKKVEENKNANNEFASRYENDDNDEDLPF